MHTIGTVSYTHLDVYKRQEFDQMTIPVPDSYGGMLGMEGRSLFAVDFETNSQILHDFLYENIKYEG